MKKINILLIGIGGYGANYIQELTEKNVTCAGIAGICEVMPDVESRFPVIREQGIPLFKTPEEFYEKHCADLAVISTPIHLHFQQIITCLRNGSHVLAEKPVCTTLEETEKLLAVEAETGRFVSVGYQLNYSRDVLAMKQDILDGRFGRPVLMKALHAMSRGEKYYHRNNWAGKIRVNGCMVNDSPFNNACAHQFQNMTFLLGAAMDQAAGLSRVEAELYRANSQLENFDTAAVRAVTENGVPIYYYTSHALKEKKLGPVSEYRFEHGTIYYGKDYGDGPVTEYVAEFEDGSRKNYGQIAKGERLQKLYDAIDCARAGGRPVCAIGCAIPHLEAVSALAQMPVWQVGEEELEHVEEDGDRYCRIRNLEKIFTTCYERQLMPSQAGARWNDQQRAVSVETEACRKKEKER